MGNEIMTIREVVARNAAAEKAMADAIQTLEEALSDAAELPEMERAEVYEEGLESVRGILGAFIRRSTIDILAEDHGVSLRRYADDRHVRLIGVREHAGVRTIWEIDVDKVEKSALISEGDDALMSISGRKNHDIEQTAIRGMLQILRERRRCSSRERHARKAEREAK